MSCVRPLLLCCFVVASLRAETVLIIQGKAGWYVPDGSSLAIPADRVILLGGSPPDPPIDPPDPPDPPTPPGELEKLSSTWDTKVVPYPKRDAHRQATQSTYNVLGAQASDGEFPDLEALKKRTRETFEIVLGSDKPKWDVPWAKDISAYLGEHVSSVAEAGPAYLEIAQGLDDPNAAANPGWVAFIELLVKAIGEGMTPTMLALIRILLGILGG